MIHSPIVRLFLVFAVAISGCGCSLLKGFKKSVVAERVLEEGAQYGIEDETEFYMAGESAEADRILEKGSEVTYLGQGSGPSMVVVRLTGGEEGEVDSKLLSEESLSGESGGGAYASNYPDEPPLPGDYRTPGAVPKIPQIRLDNLRAIAPRPVEANPMVPAPPQL